MPTYQQTIAGIQSSLSMLQFTTAWVEGRALSLADAIALAREDLPIAPKKVARTALDSESPGLSDISDCGLTPRELEVLLLVAQGHSNREIAAALFISVPTVKRHLTNVLG